MQNPLKQFLKASFILLTTSILLSFSHYEENCNAEAKEGINLNSSVPIPNQIEIFDSLISLQRYDLRERFDREMLIFVYQHSQSIATLKRAGIYFPTVEPILAKNGIPNDFKYLALIESGFNIRAVSSAKAAGIWQLMPETAKELGLEVNNEVDERYNIEKSTEAACRYFNQAYAKFGCWIMVAASYNAGMNGIMERLGKQSSKDAMDMVLPDETSRYIFRLLAAKELLKDPRKYGFVLHKEDMYHTIRVKEVKVDSIIPNLVDFAKQNNTSYFQLKNFNPWLRNTSLPVKPGKTYILKIPYPEDLNFDINKVFIYQKNWVQE